ncbi:uncharacterized protein LOC101845452 isoform X1 [Aplysia californica]|uniref:Uncharacterized protein LOC101845452 isoform X1 n=1 Tax=Aplysia californica TaxID=6500 RepID=A0ABM0JGY0_APLCA|nr:uncharacterized protein LOC101845452 isoform X1 [Aplysia californica]
MADQQQTYSGDCGSVSGMSEDSGVTDMTMETESVTSVESTSTLVGGISNVNLQANGSEGSAGHPASIDSGVSGSGTSHHQQSVTNVATPRQTASIDSGVSGSGTSHHQQSVTNFATPRQTAANVNPQNVGVMSEDSGFVSAPGSTSRGDLAQPSSVPPGNLPQNAINNTDRVNEWVDTTYEVFLKDLNGKTHTITVARDETVETFQTRVEETLSIPVEQQRLVTQPGRTLTGRGTLEDFGVKKHSTIYCNGRLRGGSVC